MASIKGPGIFIAQFLRDVNPYNSLENISKWVAGMGYKGIQIPTWESHIIDLEKAAASQTYCDEYKGKLAQIGIQPTELAAHLQGQVLAMHPAYAEGFSVFHPAGLKGPDRTDWAVKQLKMAVAASARLGLSAIPVMSGGFSWHMIYPWPQRPAGLIDEGFKELYRRWKPVLDLAADKGITIAYELHPGSDLYDGATFEIFLEVAKDHPAIAINYDPSHFVLQQLDYLHFIQLYGDRITAFHVKDAEFNPDGRVGVYGGYQSWSKRAGRFRSLGDGDVDFVRVFTLLAEAGYTGWAVLEWECFIKSPEQGAEEGAPFITNHIIQTTEVAFDDFAGGETDIKRNRRLLGLDE